MTTDTSTTPRADHEAQARPSLAKTGATSPDPAVRVVNLSHAYAQPSKRRHKSPAAPAPTSGPALDGVSFEVQPGEIFGLLGPNGSGKSTLFRILATMQAAIPPLDADAGSAQLFGADVSKNPDQARQLLGVVFQHPSIDDKLTARENLRFHGMLYGIEPAPLATRCDQLLKNFGLLERSDDRVEQFSGGMKRRVEIAKALLPRPRLLLMDEASTGLDPAAQKTLWDLLRQQVRENALTILMTTHLMHEAECCDRLGVMAQGQLLSVNTPAALIEQVGGEILEVELRDDLDEQPEQVAQSLGEALKITPDQIKTEDRRLTLSIANAAAAVPAAAGVLSGRAVSIRIGRPTLEDAYLRITGQRLSSTPN